MKDQDAPFKVLYQSHEMFICDIDADEMDNLENQVCWKPANIQDAGIR